MHEFWTIPTTNMTYTRSWEKKNITMSGDP